MTAVRVELETVAEAQADLAAGRRYQRMLGVVDEADSALRFLVDHPPVPSRPPGVGGG